MMPRNLVFVRHGQSEANVIQTADKNGHSDEKFYTEDMMLVPDRSWRLTPEGKLQAQMIGEWLSTNVDTFTRYITSPFTRTRETAGSLNLKNACWEENRVVRERSWGEIDSLPREIFKKIYPENARLMKKDPLYWAPPAGESIASVSEKRVRSLASTLHRESSDDNVIVVTHGEFMWASQLFIERWSDELFLKKDSDANHKIHNCTAIHYTRINPFTGEVSGKLEWVRKAYPDVSTGKVNVSEWRSFSRPYLSNEELLSIVEYQSHRI